VAARLLLARGRCAFGDDLGGFVDDLFWRSQQAIDRPAAHGHLRLVGVLALRVLQVIARKASSRKGPLGVDRSS
jgi:hypothetical protein